jgi:hypothetical protein
MKLIIESGRAKTHRNIARFLWDLKSTSDLQPFEYFPVYAPVEILPTTGSFPPSRADVNP